MRTRRERSSAIRTANEGRSAREPADETRQHRSGSQPKRLEWPTVICRCQRLTQSC
jgi:hypothetical protein